MTADRLVASAGGPLRGATALPGDKSLSHRALIFAAMADGESRISGLSDGEDVGRTADAVRALGAEVREEADGLWLVRGGPWRSPSRPIDCGNSGTTARLLMGAVAGRPVTATFTGDESLRRRPMARVTTPLRAMGAQVDGGDRLPITITGGQLRGMDHVNAPASAQVKSALLLAGLGADGLTRVREALPSRDHSERMLPAFGAHLEQDDGVRLTGPQELRGTDIQVPGDISSAAFPMVAALLVSGSEVTLTEVGVNPLRTGLIDTLREMGAHVSASGERVSSGEPVADLIIRSSALRGVEVPAERAPRMIDEYPVLAIAAARAHGETVMHGLGELRHKESDRLAAIVAGLAACGVRASVQADSLHVTGGPVRGGAVIDSGGDHRIAMAFLILGLVSEAPIAVEGAQMIATSFPGFVPLMRALGARVEAA
jgi:3-phosphoshikimate 1-carboxyvinyltransferase